MALPIILTFRGVDCEHIPERHGWRRIALSIGQYELLPPTRWDLLPGRSSRLQQMQQNAVQ